MELRYHLHFFNIEEKPYWRRYMIDTVLAVTSALLITAAIYVFHLYPRIHNISLLYVLVVLALASTRGRYAAIITAIVAALAFDYFLVPPFYTFTIGGVDEWLALIIFLVAAIITGQLASALRLRAEQASQREHETHILYQLVSATIREESLERQLGLVAHALVESFASYGVRDCAILLPEQGKRIRLWASASYVGGCVTLTPEEEIAACTALEQQRIVDVAEEQAATVSEGERISPGDAEQKGHSEYKQNHLCVRMFPLRIGQRSVGVVRLALRPNRDFYKKEGIEHFRLEQVDQADPRSAFFWSFLDHATSIIEHARLHQESMQMEVLRRTDELRAALLSSVSHDLRTPLASIKAAASSLLQEDVQWDEETRRSFAMSIEREADRLNRLVGNLLDMSRIEGGALKPEKEWYPVDELVHDVLSRMQLRLKDRPLQISLPDDLPPVELDYLQIDQVLTNLLENAIRYTSAGSPIEVSARSLDGLVQISVADRGPGIQPGDEEHIFDKFYSVARGEHQGRLGSGLGLAVCRGLIEAHGGRIWVEHREGGGAIFSFTLPLTTEEQAHG
jgi:two-component system sensor histidine kinase KdpD